MLLEQTKQGIDKDYKGNYFIKSLQFPTTSLTYPSADNTGQNIGIVL
jgi:hypothetical protein